MGISLAAATYLRMALDAKEVGDSARFAECIASIDETSWNAMRARFSEPLDWMAIADKYAALLPPAAPDRQRQLEA